MTDITTRARALHSVAEARERRLELELLAIWAAVRPGNPAPLTEREVLHAVEDVQSERDALRAEVASAERRAKEAEAQAAAIRKACDDRGGVHTYYVGDHGWGYYEKCPVCEDVAEAMGDAGRAILDRLAAAEAERDALRAEVERLRARKARLCDSCLGWGLARLDGSKEPCPECGRTGAVIVEGEK